MMACLLARPRRRGNLSSALLPLSLSAIAVSFRSHWLVQSKPPGQELSYRKVTNHLVTCEAMRWWCVDPMEMLIYLPIGQCREIRQIGPLDPGLAFRDGLRKGLGQSTDLHDWLRDTPSVYAKRNVTGKEAWSGEYE